MTKEIFKMKITVKSNYLIFPVNPLSKKKKLSFLQNGENVYSLDIKLDNYAPSFHAYVDVSRFIGHTLDICVEPSMELDFTPADEIDIENLYGEPMRPQVHFTTKNGWINDPNGLIYLNGTYHLFYQYNPAEACWGNMHWGHATSHDLVHWNEEKTALFPDERGAMFSGSAILDEKNLLGKETDGQKAALLYYTTTVPFSQNLSYSVDGFKSIEKYEGNPIIPHIEEENRDPKAVFCDELDCYIMALYLKDYIYCLFTSKDLVTWKELQRLTLPGDNECPDIFKLTAPDGSRKWVFSGAHGRYCVGGFESGRFEPEQEVLSHQYGNSAYAAQTFSNLPGGRIVRISWNRWGLPSHGFNGQMGFPAELSLSLSENTYYLKSTPVKEIECLYNESEHYENIGISADSNFCVRLKDTPYLIKTDGLVSGGVTEMQIFGIKLEFDFKNNEITVGNNHAPISVTSSKSDITLLIDRCSIEIFSDGGRIHMSCLDCDTICDRNIPYFVVSSDSETKIEAVEMHSLNSVWR